MTHDRLDHDHARAILVDWTDEEGLNERVERLLGTERAEQCRVFAHDIHLDVPIPLIYEIDAYTRAQLPDGELYVALFGEAYDRSYALRVQARLPDERPWIIPMGRVTVDEVRQHWRDGWPSVTRAGLELTSDEERVALLVALLPECYAEDVAAFARWAAGL